MLLAPAPRAPVPLWLRHALDDHLRERGTQRGRGHPAALPTPGALGGTRPLGGPPRPSSHATEYDRAFAAGAEKSVSKYREGVSLGFAEGQHVGFLEAYAQFRAGFKEGYYVTFWTAYERAQADFRRDMTEAMAAAAIQAGLPTPQQASLSLIASPVTPVTDRLEGRRRVEIDYDAAFDRLRALGESAGRSPFEQARAPPRVRARPRAASHACSSPSPPTGAISRAGRLDSRAAAFGPALPRPRPVCRVGQLDAERAEERRGGARKAWKGARARACGSRANICARARADRGRRGDWR